jgi:hypothetical protein
MKVAVTKANGRSVSILGLRRPLGRPPSVRPRAATQPEFDPQPIPYHTRPVFARHGPAPDPGAAAGGGPAPRPGGVRGADRIEGRGGGQDCTLATQVSLDRWPAFARQAAAWGGPASVAVYVPCPPGAPGAAAAEALVADRAAALAAALPAGARLAVSLLYARHYAREGAAELPPVRRPRGAPGRAPRLLIVVVCVWAGRSGEVSTGWVRAPIDAMRRRQPVYVARPGRPTRRPAPPAPHLPCAEPSRAAADAERRRRAAADAERRRRARRS